jgi:TRAP-type mannitol/chloroaromatic compound transport system substrate-binding protein
MVALASGVLAVVVLQSPDMSAQSRPLTADADLQRTDAVPADQQVRWRLASQFAITLPETGTLLAETVGRVEALTDGSLRLDVTEPKDIAQPLGLFDAVAGGAFDAAFIWPATIKGQTAAFELYGGIPFGPSAGEFLAWYEKTGRALSDDLYHAHNVHGLLCGMVAAGGGWFRADLKRPADIDRLPVAAFGLAGRTLAQFGAHPVALPPGEIGRAYKGNKVVGATMLSPAADRQIMRDSDARRYFFPSWAHAWAGLDLIVNLDTWQALPERKRQTLESVCAANLATSYATSQAAQYDVLKDMIKEGIDVRRLPASFVGALNTAWTQVSENLQRDDPDFRRAWVSLAAFRENQALWRELTTPTPPAKP